MSQVVHGTRFVMGTFLTVRIWSQTSEQAALVREAIFEKIQQLDHLLSYHSLNSDISRLNRTAGTGPQTVDPKTFDVIEKACRYAEMTSGAFDPTFRSNRRKGYQEVRCDPDQRRIDCPSGITLDLGAIGKGFALDQALDDVRRMPTIAKIEMDFGGQLLFWNAGPFDPISVSIENPNNPNTIIKTVDMTANGSVSTSSQVERPGHLVSPKNARAVALRSGVTVIAPTATKAEVLSTALFVMPESDGLALLKRCPEVQAFLY